MQGITTLAKLQADLDEVRQAISDAITIGKQAAVPGSHSVSPQSIDVLRKRERRLKAQIRTWRGIPSVSLPGNEAPRY